MGSEEIAILRSLTMSQRFHLGCVLNRRARRRYREKLERELPEWSAAERDRILRAATTFGTIDTAEDWQEVYRSEEYQAWLAGEGAPRESRDDRPLPSCDPLGGSVSAGLAGSCRAV